MGGFFSAISNAISGIGQSILGAFQSIGNFLKNTFTSAIDFIGKIPGYISDGFEWVGKQLGSLFKGDTGGIAETTATVNTSTATNSLSGVDSALGNFSPDGITNMVSNGYTVPALSSSMGGTAGVIADSAGATRATQDGVVNTVGKVAGSTAGEASKPFGSITEFFKTDLGGMVGKGMEAGLTYMAMQQMTKNQEKMQESMARRQEQSNKEQWLREEQRRSEMTAWSAQRANEEARAQANNSWSGFTGKWVNPTTEVPVPQA
jgi:phage-related protein